MIHRRSAEQFLAESDGILQRFETSFARGAQDAPVLEEALLQLRKLGFTSGEALHLLRKPRRIRD